MTRRLILIRHAKSSWDDPALSDHDRPLNRRGERAARALGAWLASRGHVPDEVLCSTALRARATWEGIAAVLPAAPPLRLEPRLYHAPPEVMRAVLRGAEGGTVAMIGHNPGIAAFAAELLREAPPDPDLARYPTGATAVIDFAIAAWAELQPRTGVLRDFVTPRALE